MIVYHSSYLHFTKPDVLHSRDALDFGKGFYVTRFKEQAEKYANRFLRTGKDAYIHEFEFLPSLTLNTKIFTSYDEEWLEFVCSCRKGGTDYRKFDIIEGGVANDKVFQTVDLYMAGIYTNEQALQNLMFEMPNNQLCFTSQRAIDECLSFIKYTQIKNG